MNKYIIKNKERQQLNCHRSEKKIKNKNKKIRHQEMK